MTHVSVDPVRSRPHHGKSRRGLRSGSLRLGSPHRSGGRPAFSACDRPTATHTSGSCLMRTGTIARSIAVTGAALLAVSACGGSSDNNSSSGSSGSSGEKQTKVYGTDGNMGNALGEDFTKQGSLAGMSGTTPLTNLNDDFKKRLLTVDPALKDYNYSGESYDAVTITALAAQMAGTNDANTFKAYVNGVTVGGDKCTDFKSCLAVINSGGNPDLDGVTGPLAFADAGEPAKASFGLEQFGTDNKIDDSKTKFVLAGDEANATTNEGP